MTTLKMILTSLMVVLGAACFSQAQVLPTDVYYTTLSWTMDRAIDTTETNLQFIGFLCIVATACVYGAMTVLQEEREFNQKHVVIVTPIVTKA